MIARSVDEAFDEIRAASAGETPRTILDTTGNSRVFSALLQLAPSFGRIVLLGDTGRPEEQRLTGDVLTRGLHIVGAHDGHELDGWTGERVARLFFRLVASGRFDPSGLITNVFAPADCQEAYELPQRDRASTMGIIFDWAGAGCP